VIVIAQPYALFVRTLPLEKLDAFAAQMLVECEPLVREVYGHTDDRKPVGIEAYLETGSTRAWLTVSAGVALLINYGAVRQSIDYLIADAKRVGDLVLPMISSSLNMREAPKLQQRRHGVPGTLKRLFHAVGRGEMTADEATARAFRLLQPDADQADLSQALDAFRAEAQWLEDAKPYGPADVDQEVLITVDDKEPQLKGKLVVPPAPDDDNLGHSRLPTLGPARKGTLQVSDERRRAGVRARRNPSTKKVEVQPY
jgi:hypothetical protein